MKNKPINKPVNKMVIVINGRSQVGKDSLIAMACNEFKIRNVSSIDPIKEIARMGGWDGIKDEKGRTLLIGLKQLFVEYSDLPLKYLARHYDEFLKSEEQFMFVHIREPEEIAKFESVIPCRTLLIKRKYADRFDLDQDDHVEDYDYDFNFINDKMLGESGQEFTKFLKQMIGAR